MGCYIAHDDASAIEDVIAAIRAVLMVACDFNADLDEPERSARAEEIAAALASAWLEDMSAHFLPRRRSWSRYGRTWSMWRGNRVVHSRTYYLLGNYHRLYQNVSFRDVRHKSDHYRCARVYRGGTGVGACVLPWGQSPLPPSTAVTCERRGPPIRRTPRGGTQTPVEGTRMPGVDLSRDLTPSQ